MSAIAGRHRESYTHGLDCTTPLPHLKACWITSLPRRPNGQTLLYQLALSTIGSIHN
jgi:hypothetical protein